MKIEQVISIVREAGKLLLDRDMEVIQKGNNSNFVTSVDIKVQDFLSKALQDTLPGSLVLGEESEKKPENSELLWVIDPIDGTSNFIRNLGLSAISVGLMKHGEPVMGVVFLPYTNEMYWGEKGCGAFLNGKQIHVSDRDFAHSHLCSAMSLYDKRYAPPCLRIIEQVYSEADDLRRFGSAALELAYLSAGRVELYFEIRVFAWDVAGMIPIILEAGGFVECLYHDTIPLDKPFPFLAANSRENMQRLSEIVHKEITQLPY